MSLSLLILALLSHSLFLCSSSGGGVSLSSKIHFPLGLVTAASSTFVVLCVRSPFSFVLSSFFNVAYDSALLLSHIN